MFSHLSQRLVKTIRNLSGRGRLTAENISDTLRDIRLALLEADVALEVVKQFIAQIKSKAIGNEVIDSVTPGQTLIKIVHDELAELLGGQAVPLKLNATPPVVILIAGLQGAGKTTTAAKLAYFLKNQEKKSVLLASADTHRPAAIDQLAKLAKDIAVDFLPNSHQQHAVTIAKNALLLAKKQFNDVVIIDTAGRLHIDEAMMREIQAIHNAIKPHETLFVADSIMGQDAANTAKAFNELLDLTGVILTKIDGDARGGAALSIRLVTNKPIKFVGSGEKVENLEAFYPKRLASRILDMGDVVSLVEQAKRRADLASAKKLTKKIKKGKGFDLQDFLEQLEQMKKMGGFASLISKLPGMQQLPKALKSQFNDNKFMQMKAIIQSMTPRERRYPDIIKGKRKIRITKGSGTQIQDLNRLLKQFTQMQKMMKKLAKGGMVKTMRNLSSLMPGDMNNFPPLE